MSDTFAPIRGESVWPVLIQSGYCAIPASHRVYIRPRNEGPAKHDVFNPTTKCLEAAAEVFRTREEALAYANGQN